MDIDTLKEALGDEKFKALQSYVVDLVGQRDEARNESITGRKGLKAKLESAEAAQAKMLEKLGIETLDELDAMPDAKGLAEASKQFETKLKRLQRERDEAAQQRDDATGKFKSSLQRAAVAEAMAGHKFVARDIVETFVGNSLVWEGDDLLFKTGDGKLVPVKDGVAGIAKSRPELLEATGTGGAGVRQSNAGGSGSTRTMTRAEFEALTPVLRVEAAKAGVQLS